MHVLTPLRTQPRRRVVLLTGGMIVRLVFALALVAAVSVLTFPSLARAGEILRLRGDVTAKSDVLTLGDLVENAPTAFAGRALFRAPALGAIGTVQTRRIAEAINKLDLGPIESGGRVQIQVQRAARRIGAAEIETALKRALEAAHGLDAKLLAVRLDGEAQLLVPVDLDGQAQAFDVTYDPRSHRIAGLIVLGARQASLRVTGQALALREVAVLTRSIARGESLAATDIAIEKRPREALGSETLGAEALGAGAFGEANGAFGQVAQRALNAGAVLRNGDLAPPELVLRGESVTIVFETPGVSLSLTGIANESGRLGSTIAVLNPTSKKVLQAVVVAPGRVAVGPVRSPAPIVQANAALDPRPGLN